MVGRHVAGPRGGSAWEERGGCHPCVVGGVCPPSTGYMVGLLRHVSPTTSLSPCFLHVLSPKSLLPTFHRVPPQACPGPPTSRASPSLRPQPITQAARKGCLPGSRVLLLLRLQQLQQKPCSSQLSVVCKDAKLAQAIRLHMGPEFPKYSSLLPQWLLTTFTRSDLFIRL